MTAVLVILGALVALLLLSRVGRAGRMRRRRQAGKVVVKVIRRTSTGPVRMCPDCGEPAGKCREMTRRAEHPTGMLGPRKGR